MPDHDGPLSGRAGSRVSARFRIAGWILLTTVLGLTALVVTVRSSLVADAYRDANADLVQETDEFRRFADVGSDPESGEPFTSTSRLLETYLERQRAGGDEVLIGHVPGTDETWSVSGNEVPADVADRLLADEALLERMLEEGSGTGESVLGPVRWVGTDVQPLDGDDGRYVVVEVLARDLADVARTTRLMVAVAGVSALVTGAWALVVAGQVLRPLRVIRRTVEEISEHDLSRRIPVEGDDDLAEVATTVNGVLDRLQTSLDHEQVFVDEARAEVAAPLDRARRHLREAVDPQAALAELDVLERVLDDLHDLATSRRPGFVRPAPTDAAALGTDLLAAVHDLDPAQDWVLTDVGAGGVRLDADRVREAVLRLAANAVRHSPPGAAVALATTFADGPHGRELQVTVSDRGPGLDAEQAGTVFDPLTSARDGRTGLGLALVRAVADAHGGSAFVRSVPGRGATFGLALPAPAQDAPPAPAEEAR